MTRHPVQLSDKTYKLLEDHRKNKKQDAYLYDCMTQYSKLELEKLKEEIQLYKPTANPKKEAWKKRVEAEANLPLTYLDFADCPCHYRAITEEGILYCDVKKMPKEVCIRRQKRFLTMNRMCKPVHLASKKSQTTRWQPKGGDKGDTQLWRG